MGGKGEGRGKEVVRKWCGEKGGGRREREGEGGGKEVVWGEGRRE